MLSKIEGGVLPVLTLTMENGEEIFVEAGGMSWMTDSFEMQTNTKGGLLKGLGRVLSGDSLFMNTYKCVKPEGQIAFASSFPGQIMEFDLTNNQSIICQKSAFLCAEKTVNMSMYFNKKIGAGFLGGEGFIMQKIQGPGKAFIECDGSLTAMDLKPGELLKVSSGYVAAFEETVTMNVEAVAGIKNMVFGGEGFFLTTLKGPGRVYLQSMTICDLAQRITPYVPKIGN